MPVLYLLPLAFIFDLVGYLPPYLRLFLVYLLLGLPLCLQPSRRSVRAALGLGAIAVAVGLLAPPTIAELFLLVVAHQWVWYWLGPVHRRFGGAIFAYAFLYVWLFQSPLGDPVVEVFSGWGSRFSSSLTGSTYHLGPTYQGLGAFLLFLCLSSFGLDRSRASWLRMGAFGVGAILANALLSAVLLRKVDFAADFVWELKYRDVFDYAALWQQVPGLVLLSFPGFCFLAYLLVYWLLHHETWRGEEEGDAAAGGGRSIVMVWAIPTRAWGVVVALGSVLVVLILVPPTGGRSPSPSRVVFLERGVVSFTKPDYTRYGRAAGGMYGLFPEYCRLFGCEAMVVKEIPKNLDSKTILVLTNLDEPLSPVEHQEIWDFVRAGGRLWVLGDHTFIKNGRNHINDLLEPSHIRLRHDSAQFFPQGWFNSYWFAQGTPFASLTDLAENRPAILVGASLELGVPALPLIQGQFGYSDWGVKTPEDQRGYIGDFEYQAEERLGDLALVAGEEVGRGRVLVFGDTTSFFNNNLSRSYELLRASLSWLGEGRVWMASAGWLGRFVAAGAVLAMALMIFLANRPWMVMTALGAAAVCVYATQGTGCLLEFERDFAREKLALIDFSHQPFASRHSSMNSGLHGITINLIRYGLLPATLNQWDRDALEATRLLVVNAPRQPFSRREERDLTGFMTRGGTVVWACGYPHFEMSRHWLESLGLQIRGLPLGRFFDRQAFGRPVSFHSAWPIEVRNPAAQVLCVYEDWPLMVVVPMGQGRLILIADSEFLHNKNLEGFENYDPANVQFVRSLLDYLNREGQP